MALTLIATPGASNANSYATVAEGHAYHEGHLYASVWNAGTTTDETRAQALVWATRLLDEHTDWFGVVASQTQALRWPRFGVEDLDGRLFGSDVIPQKLKDATIELARLLLATDLTAGGGGSAGGALEEIKVGPINLKFEGAVSATVETIPDSVYFALRTLGVPANRTAGSVALDRV